MIVVLATTEAGLSGAVGRLGDFGLAAEEVVAPSVERRLVLASVPDESEGSRIVARLQSEGRSAVLRPSGGVRLEAWVRHTRPISVGDRLSVCFVWSEHDRRDLPGVVELDPGGGFGSGGHPSTQSLLRALERRIQGGERVLDVGCGSGLLGLSTLRLGASSVVGVDVDARAIEALGRNAALNGLAAGVDGRAVPLGAIEGVFDVVVANIGWAPLLELAPELIGHLAPGGWLGVSGIAPAHCSRIVASLRPLEVLENPVHDGWAALIFRPLRA